jgi:phosphoglycolate phosphatase-like HAD superfamily hydrolase
MPAPHAAVIFDVDGPLLHLTPPEEDAFFHPFKALYGLSGLSNDWDSYRIRNDREIILEILENHFGRQPHDHEYHAILEAYRNHLEDGFATGSLVVSAIPGARDLLARLDALGSIALGTATANVRHAAQVRLAQAGMWDFVKDHPGAADEGGAKRDVLARVIDGLSLPRERIVFLGDNLNDLDAGQHNDVHFIGFHVDADRRQRLTDHGAAITCGDHAATFRIISDMLNL